MDKKSLKMMTLIAAILSAGPAGALVTPPSDADSRQALEGMIQSGKIKLDHNTGRLALNASVLEVLRDAGVVRHVSSTELPASGATMSTTGGCGDNL